MSHPRIATDPDLWQGKPYIKGTDITVEMLIHKLGAVRSFDDVLIEYPELKPEDLLAALDFASEFMQTEPSDKAE